ncbi:MAG: hypothetical protein Q4G69_01070 [Planctomycetia bacterium]|nr:hypothetical protein [Planctomycetia bacterium]
MNDQNDNGIDANPYAGPVKEDFLKDAMQYRDNFEDEQEFQEALAIWPVCPQCGRRRTTRCPICKVSGNLFPLGDDTFWVEPAQETGSSDHSCSCGGNCGCHHGSAPADRSNFPSQLAGEIQPGLRDYRYDSPYSAPYPEKTEAPTEAPKDLPNLSISVSDPVYSGITPAKKLIDLEKTAEEERKVLKLAVCHVCSEPFVPRFPARCEWCGHVFDLENRSEEDQESEEESEFIPPDPDSYQRNEEINPRIMLVLTIMGIAAIGAFLYLWALF